MFHMLIHDVTLNNQGETVQTIDDEKMNQQTRIIINLFTLRFSTFHTFNENTDRQYIVRTKNPRRTMSILSTWNLVHIWNGHWNGRIVQTIGLRCAQQRTREIVACRCCVVVANVARATCETIANFATRWSIKATRNNWRNSVFRLFRADYKRSYKRQCTSTVHVCHNYNLL